MFQQTTIVGVGLIGGSLALDLRQAGLCQRIYGVGRTQSNLDIALERNLIDKSFQNLKEGIEGSDLIVLATPVHTLVGHLKELIPLVGENTLIIDAGSVKQPLVDVGRSLMTEGKFVPCHPIAGTEKGGAAHAFPGLFRGARCIITPTEETPETSVQKATYVWEQAGMIIQRMDASDHDALFARISHLPHLVAYGLVGFLQNGPTWHEQAPYAGGGFRDFTRIAASPPEMWTDIVRLNRKEVLGCVRGYGEQMKRMGDLIEAEDYQGLRELLDKASRVKKQMESEG